MTHKWACPNCRQMITQNDIYDIHVCPGQYIQFRDEGRQARMDNYCVYYECVSSWERAAAKNKRLKNEHWIDQEIGI